MVLHKASSIVDMAGHAVDVGSTAAPDGTVDDFQSMDTQQWMANLTGLVLRQESTLNCILSENQFMLHLGIGNGSILPTLYAETQKWKQSDHHVPRRHHLALLMMNMIHERLERLSSTPDDNDAFKHCIKYHLVTTDWKMPFLDVNGSTSGL